MFRRSRKRPLVEGQGRVAKRSLPHRTNVFSYHKYAVPTEGKPQNERFVQAKTEKRKHQANRLLFTIVILVVLTGLFWAIRLNNQPDIEVLTNNYSSYFMQPIGTYKQAAQKLFKGSIANDNKLTVNTVAIASDLQKEFPELSNVTVDVPLIGSTPKVYLEPAEPAIELDSQLSGPFIVSTAGEAILGLSSNRDDAFNRLPKVIDKTGLQIATGRGAMSTNDVAFIQEISTQLAAKHIVIKSMTLPGGSREIDVALNSASYVVKFNLQASPSAAEQQIGTFLATYSYLRSHNINPREYVDARVPGRAYYK